MDPTGRSAADARRLEMLATTLATRTQVGAIVSEYERRLGVRGRDDRLAISAVLLGLDELRSTRDLTMGEAGALLQILRAARDRAELSQRVATAERERLNQQRARRASVADVLRDFFRIIAGVPRERRL